MFFVLLCLLLVVLLANGVAIDQFGWLMLIGTGWIAGYLDCRKFARSDQDPDRVMPPDARADAEPDDHSLFQS